MGSAGVYEMTILGVEGVRVQRAWKCAEASLQNANNKLVTLAAQMQSAALAANRVTDPRK